MRRLSRERISALRLSFEAWPDVGQEHPVITASPPPTSSRRRRPHESTKEGKGAAFEDRQTAAIGPALRLAAQKHSCRIAVYQNAKQHRRTIECRSRASIARNHCRQVESLDYCHGKARGVSREAIHQLMAVEELQSRDQSRGKLPISAVLLQIKRFNAAILPCHPVPLAPTGC